MLWVVVGVLAFAIVGNAMATPEQRAQSRQFVNKLEPYAVGLTIFMIGFIVVVEMLY